MNNKPWYEVKTGLRTSLSELNYNTVHHQLIQGIESNYKEGWTKINHNGHLIDYDVKNGFRYVVSNQCLIVYYPDVKQSRIFNEYRNVKTFGYWFDSSLNVGLLESVDILTDLDECLKLGRLRHQKFIYDLVEQKCIKVQDVNA